jgi:hypothetical protein
MDSLSRRPRPDAYGSVVVLRSVFLTGKEIDVASDPQLRSAFRREILKLRCSMKTPALAIVCKMLYGVFLQFPRERQRLASCLLTPGEPCTRMSFPALSVEG